MSKQTEDSRSKVALDRGAVGPEARGMSRALSLTENAIYLSVAVLLAGLAAAILVSGLIEFVSELRQVELRGAAVALLDNTLLVLMLVELLHTVGISLKEHRLVPDPFLVVGLIAAIRRILVITAEQGAPTAEKEVAFRLAMLELGLLTVLVLALVGALIALGRFRAREAGEAKG